MSIIEPTHKIIHVDALCVSADSTIHPSPRVDKSVKFLHHEQIVTRRCMLMHFVYQLIQCGIQVHRTLNLHKTLNLRFACLSISVTVTRFIISWLINRCRFSIIRNSRHCHVFLWRSLTQKCSVAPCVSTHVHTNDTEIACHYAWMDTYQGRERWLVWFPREIRGDQRNNIRGKYTT